LPFLPPFFLSGTLFLPPFFVHQLLQKGDLHARCKSANACTVAAYSPPFFFPPLFFLVPSPFPLFSHHAQIALALLLRDREKWKPLYPFPRFFEGSFFPSFCGTLRAICVGSTTCNEGSAGLVLISLSSFPPFVFFPFSLAHREGRISDEMQPV